MKYDLKLLVLSIPVFLLIISVIAFIFNTRIAEGKPFVEELSPNVLSGGETLEIRGKDFGGTRDSSNVFVASLDILSKHILSWSDELIVIEVPDKAGSGLVTVGTGRGMSNPLVLVIDKNVPFISTGAYLPGLPFIETIDPSLGGAGSIVTIKGDNFGSNRNNSRLLFSSLFSKEVDTLGEDTILKDFLDVSHNLIISWKNKEISFYLPEFVSTGDVYIETESGFSNAVYFEQSLNESGFTLENKKTYMFEQSILLKGSGITDESKVNLWFSSPSASLNQRNIVNLPDSNIFSSFPCPEVTLYEVLNLKDSEEIGISQKTIVDVYEQKITLLPDEIIDNYDKRSPLYVQYTGSTDFIPADAARVKAVARSITRRKKSNYEKVRAIYDYVAARLTYSEELEVRSPDLVIDTQLGDSQAYSLLFTALVRSSGIPARPVTGILVDSIGNSKNHWWSEFYIQGFGWFPVDLALADGLQLIDDIENPVEYYWGNIDNQHIAFSRGERSVSKLFPGGVVYSDNQYTNVTHNVETDSSIAQLRSTWSDVIITAIY